MSCTQALYCEASACGLECSDDPATLLIPTVRSACPGVQAAPSEDYVCVAERCDVGVECCVPPAFACAGSMQMHLVSVRLRPRLGPSASRARPVRGPPVQRDFHFRKQPGLRR